MGMFRPSFWTRFRSYFWPVTIEKRKGGLNHELEVWGSREKLNLKKSQYHFYLDGLDKDPIWPTVLTVGAPAPARNATYPAKWQT